MAGERPEYVALHGIDDPRFGVVAYRVGQGVAAQVVDDWGLELDVDVARDDAVNPGDGQVSLTERLARVTAERDGLRATRDEED